MSLGFPAENIKVHPDNEGEANEFGYIDLGIPVGSKEFCTVKLDQLIEKFTSVFANAMKRLKVHSKNGCIYYGLSDRNFRFGSDICALR